MKKIINDPKNYVKETLEGTYIAHPDKVVYASDDLQCLINVHNKEGKVGIATGGGSDHLLPLLGYAGDGMLDGCCVGDVFQLPNAKQMLAVTKHTDQGAGVLCIYGNYNGDIFNFDMAAEAVDFEYDIRVETVLDADDIVSAGSKKEGDKSTRRGVVGIVFVYKCVGAAVNRMTALDEVKRIAEKAGYNVRTMGITFTPCVIPCVGKVGLEIGLDEMEIGMGIHGETGIRRGRIESADQIVDEMLDKIVVDLPYAEGDEIVVLADGLGAIPLDEQYITARCIQENLTPREVKVHRYYVGESVTTLEMAGLSISLLELGEELKEFLDGPADTPFFKQ